MVRGTRSPRLGSLGPQSVSSPAPHALGLPHPQLLGLAVASMAALTYFGAHFAVLGHASSERTSYKAMHRWGE